MHAGTNRTYTRALMQCVRERGGCLVGWLPEQLGVQGLAQWYLSSAQEVAPVQASTFRTDRPELDLNRRLSSSQATDPHGNAPKCQFLIVQINLP